MEVLEPGERIPQRLGLGALQSLHDVVDFLTLPASCWCSPPSTDCSMAASANTLFTFSANTSPPSLLPARLLDGIVQTQSEPLDRSLRLRASFSDSPSTSRS